MSGARPRALAVLALLAGVSGCDLAPHYVRPAAAVPATWPTGAAYAPALTQPPGMSWRTMISDPRLTTVIERALANNQNLRAAVANVASARAQYRIQRAAQFPEIDASAGATISHSSGTQSVGNTVNTTGGTYHEYDVQAGISSFEIDLFGRLKNLSKEAFDQYLATDEGRRSTRITIIAETATAYATYAADSETLAVARQTLASGERTLELARSLFNAGLAPLTDVENAITIVAQAQSDIAADTTQVAQDANALRLLVGAEVEPALLPTSLDLLDGGIADVPAGLSSTVILQRPDVRQAEYQLEATNAEIGAARAAFFPTITLTSAVGLASTALSSLFTGGAFAWNVAPTASVPVIGGTNRGNLAYARAQHDYYLAEYQKAVQTAFSEVANGLARRGTIDRQRAAQGRLVGAAQSAYALADAQYRAGTDTFLDALVAQRTLYSARLTAVSAALSDISNRISIYEYLGADDGR